MNIDVIEVVEQPDGSARITLDLDSSALAMIVEKFVTEALTKEVNAFEKQKEIDSGYADDSLSSILYGNKD